jgi:uncharacterized protein
MFFDTHCHASQLAHWDPKIVKDWFDPFGTPMEVLDVDPAHVVARMEAGKIQRSCLLAFDAQRAWGSRVPNEYVAEIVQTYPDKFIGFASVDPLMGEAAARELEHCVKELGLRGLKISPIYQEYPPACPEAMILYAKAEELGVPIVIHQAWTVMPRSPMKYALPYLLDDVMIAFPELRMISAHIGVPWVSETLCMAAKHRNFYVDISGRHSQVYQGALRQLFRDLTQAGEMGLWHKVLWGSDHPWVDPADYLQDIRNINEYADILHMDPIPQEAIDGFTGGNAYRMLTELKIL